MRATESRARAKSAAHGAMRSGEGAGSSASAAEVALAGSAGSASRVFARAVPRASPSVPFACTLPKSAMAATSSASEAAA